MSQVDYNVANADGATVRADINAQLDGIVTNNSGGSEPATMFANMWWFDTATNDLKQRNEANTAWVLAARKNGSGWTPYRQGVLMGFAVESPMVAVLDTNGNAIDESEGTPVASAATTDIWSTDGNTLHVTGTTTITSFGAAPRIGARRMVIFDDALTLTDGANLNLPGAADITTAADDFAIVYAETTTLFKVLYFKADGTPVVVSNDGRLVSVQVFTTPGANTWTKPAGINAIRTQTVGGGGGGGTSNTNLVGAGGGGGGYSEEFIPNPSASETATIGAGGAAAAAGGTSSFGSLSSATGGSPGGSGGVAIGGLGGVGSGGDVNVGGADGASASRGAASQDMNGGQGGNSVLGGGGRAGAEGAGTAGNAFGGGGGGGGDTSGTGGVGAAGVVIVWEYS